MLAIIIIVMIRCSLIMYVASSYECTVGMYVCALLLLLCPCIAKYMAILSIHSYMKYEVLIKYLRMYAYIMCMYIVYMFLYMYACIHAYIQLCMNIIQSFILLMFTYVSINRPTHFSAY